VRNLRNVVTTISPFIGPRHPPAKGPTSVSRLALVPPAPVRKAGPAGEERLLAFLESWSGESVCELAREARRELTSGGPGVELPEGAAAELCRLDLLLDGEDSGRVIC